MCGPTATLIDLSHFTTRFYSGSEAQSADPLIEEIEGAGNTPAYRGLCYIVFEDMPLAALRQPHSAIAVRDHPRAFGDANPDALENRLAGVALIPGAGEFVYATEVVSADDGKGTTIAAECAQCERRSGHRRLARRAAGAGAESGRGVAGRGLVRRRSALRRMRSSSRASKIDGARKTATYPQSWSVNGVGARIAPSGQRKSTAAPAYGGTPSDESVVQAIRESQSARACACMFCPFLFMDIAAATR